MRSHLPPKLSESQARPSRRVLGRPRADRGEGPVTRRLVLAQRPQLDAGVEAVRALARALLPHLRELMAAERHREDLVEVAAVVPLPRRLVLAACRRGKVSGAVKRGRRWLATRAAVDAWLRAKGPRAMSSPADEDDLEPLRRSLAGS
jgi:hypothetical protein